MRSRISRGSGYHDRRPIRLGTARGGAGLPPPARHAARGDVAADRGSAPGAARARARAAALAALGPRRRRRARDRRGPGPGQHAAPADHRRRAGRSRLPGGGGAVPEPHRGLAHGVPLRSERRADRPSVRRPGARPAHDHAVDARFAGRGGPQAQEPARGSRARVGPDRPGPSGQRPRGPPVDQPGIGTTQRAAAAAHGEPRRARPRARARSTVMQGVQLLVAVVVAIQRPALPPQIGLALAQAQAALTAVAPAVDALDGLDALDQLDALDGLDALDALDALDGGDPTADQDDQDPTDSLWQAARRAFNRGDDDDLRIAALNGLLQMDAANAVPILKRVLARRDACSAGMRRKAVFLLSQKRTGETEDVLLDVAQHDPNSEVRQQAVFWLSQVPTERAVGMLDSILKTTRDEELQDKAIFALSQQRSPRAGQALRAYAERSDASVEARGKAIFWLGQQRSAENAAYLRTLYSKLAEP